MTAQQVSTKAAISVTEMAAMCDLSRSRFYVLMQAGMFPPPVHNQSTKRPVYLHNLIEKCLEIRRTGIGLDGKIVLFNRKRSRRAQRKSIPSVPQESPYVPLVAGLKSLGLVDVTDSQVGSAVGELYPGGINSHDVGEVIRQLFLALRKQ